jgi:hypothetical protein
MDSTSPGYGSVAGSCEHDNKPSDSIEFGVRVTSSDSFSRGILLRESVNGLVFCKVDETYTLAWNIS